MPMKAYPQVLQNILLPVAEKLLGTPYISVIREWQQLEKQDPQTIQTIQQKKLEEILTHAQRNVPGYQSLPSDAKLHDFPISTKAMYLKNEDLWIASGFKKEDLLIEKSSGSSGIQGKVYMSKAESMSEIAHQTFLWTWSGYQPGDMLLQLGMTPNRGIFKKIKDLLFRTNYTQAFDLNKEEVITNLHAVKGKDLNMFFGGYASGLYEYARITMAQNIKNVHFKAVISWGDKMFDHYRSLIESEFQCKVYDTYGTTEGFVIAGQCDHGSYHILTPHLYLEVLDDFGQEVAAGTWGHVVVTRLDAFAMPLIRYRLGDLAIKEDPNKTCACGRPFPMLRKIIGRDTDVVRTPAGKALIVHFFTGIFEHIEEIRQFQVVQNKVDCLTIKYISELKDELIGEVLQNAKRTMDEKAGETLHVYFERVEEIKSSPSGKPQIILSQINREKQ